MSSLPLLPHDPSWARQAEQVRATLQALAGPACPVELIGSTAVAGLCAKPVLDLMLGVADWSEVAEMQPRLAAARWRYRPEHEAEIPDRRYFVRDADAGLPRQHLHILRRDGALWQRHLAFRDALRTRPEWRDRYAALKQTLAAAHAGDKTAYQAGKAPFIQACLRELGL